MDLFWNIFAVFGSVCSFGGFIWCIAHSGYAKKIKYVWYGLLFVMTLLIGTSVYLNSELKRIKDIHKQAESVCNDYSINHSEYIHEVLMFLEENKDRYPDAYERANHIYAALPEPESIGSFDAYNNAAEAMHGIIKGVITINE